MMLSFRRFSSLCLLSLSLVLGACINTPPVSDLPEAPKNVAPKLMGATELPPYLLQVGDVLDVRLLENPELNDSITVRPDGYVSTTVAHDVKAYGRTVSELREDLQREYTKQLRNPRVSVIVRSFAPTRVYVTGEVVTSGEFITVGPALTVSQAIARAGGLRPSASADEIVIIRRGAAEKPQVLKTSYKDAITGAAADSDVRLAPYDVVYVPRTGIADVYLYFQQYVQQFVPSAFGLSYSLNTP
jgi:polysaccharide biosynthesis/export protein